MERFDNHVRNIGGTGRPRPSLAFALALLVLALAAPAFAFAQGPPPGPRPGRGPGPDPMLKHDEGRTAEIISQRAEELGIDGETAAKIQEIVASSRERGEELRFQLEQAHRKLGFMLTRDQPVEEEVLAQAQTIGEIRIEESKHRLRSLLAIRSLLTKEQREKLAEMRMSERGGDVREACQDDIERLCGDAERGFHTMLCMREHRDELSDTCSEAIEQARQRRGGHWGPPHEDGGPPGSGGGGRWGRDGWRAR